MGEVTYVPRSEWGARPWKNRAPFVVPAGDRRGTACHWNGPPMGIVDHSQCWVKVLSIQRYHQGLGWSDIAYSHLFCDHGYVFEGRGWGWDQFANGDDNVGVNDGNDRVWFTAMWLGGEGETPTPAAMDAFRWLVAEGRSAGCGLAVKPHSDFHVKPCPGPELTAECRRMDGLVTTPQEIDVLLTDKMVTKPEWSVNDVLVWTKEDTSALTNAVAALAAAVAAIAQDVDEIQARPVSAATIAAVDAAAIARAAADEIAARLTVPRP